MARHDKVYPIRGLGVTRADIAQYVYRDGKEMSAFESDVRADRLTDKQMKLIADNFLGSLTGMRFGTIDVVQDDGDMFPMILRETYRWLEENSGI
jgi:hypothetical protein